MMGSGLRNDSDETLLESNALKIKHGLEAEALWI